MKRVDDIAKSNLSLPAKWLAVFMTHHENRNGEVIVSVDDIRGWTALSKAAIRDGLHELEHAGFLIVKAPFKPGRNSSATFAPTFAYTPRRSAYATDIRHDVAQLVSDGAETPDLDTPRINHPEIPFPLNNPLPNPSPSLSPVSSFSPVLENEGLRQEQEVTREAQGELIQVELPEWASRLIGLPQFAARGITPTEISHIETDYRGVDLNALASTFVAWWTDETKRDMKRPMATWRNWCKKEKSDGAAQQNGRYPRRRGLGPAVIPNDPSYYDPGSKLSAFRPR